MEFKGKIIKVLAPNSGVSRSTGKEWMSQDYVIEELGGGQYPSRLLFTVFGIEKIQQFGIKEGEVLNVSFDTNAKSYKDKWYNDIRAWRVFRDGENQQQSAVPNATPAPKEQPAPQVAETSDGDLPF